MSRPIRIKVQAIGAAQAEDRKPTISVHFGSYAYVWIGDSRGCLGILDKRAEVKKLRDALDRVLADLPKRGGSR